MLHPAAGYLAFATLVLFLIGLAMLPAPERAKRGADKIGRVTLACFFSRPRTAADGVRSRCCRRRRRFPVAARLRGEGVPIGELFAHMSGLYFRGKITYARKFGRAFVITPDQGLVPAETTITSQVLVRFADAEIDLGNPGYRTPLEQTARALDRRDGRPTRSSCCSAASRRRNTCRCSARFSARASCFPPTFVGRGDMSRGGVAAARRRRSQELEYIPVIGAVRHGSRPPRLAPVTPFSRTIRIR